MIKSYKSNRNEIELDFKLNSPPTIYKYRSWGNEYHQRIIAQKEIWFAHPFDLNDPFDIRPPYEFQENITDWNKFRQKLESAGRKIEKNISENRLQQMVEENLSKAKYDPIGYFLGNRSDYIFKKENYDDYGIFSCCISGVNEVMWAHYGDNHCGFAIGFNSWELFKAIKCYCGVIEYNDNPIKIDMNLIISSDYEQENEYYLELVNQKMFQKSTKWKMEEEFRFITASININRNRTIVFPKNCVEEILIGANTSQETTRQISRKANLILPGVPIYRVKPKLDGYGFEKKDIK